MQIGPMYIPFEYLVVGLIAIFIVINLVANSRRRQRFAADSDLVTKAAAMRGWVHTAEFKGVRETHQFSGETGGVSWRIETLLTHGGSEDANRRYTRWWTEQVTLPGEAILIMPRFHNTIQLGQVSAANVKSNPLARMAMTFFMNTVLGESGSVADFEYAQPVEAGSAKLKESYSVLATSESTASRFLDDDAQKALIDWAEGDDAAMIGSVVAVAFWSKGIYIALREGFRDPGQLEGLVKLGAALASGQRGA